MAIYLNNTIIKRGNSGIPVIYEGENLDEVLARQETLVANIKTTLEGKAGAPPAYVDEDGYLYLSAGSVVNDILEV